MRCDSETGYVYDVDIYIYIYAGKAQEVVNRYLGEGVLKKV